MQLVDVKFAESVDLEPHAESVRGDLDAGDRVRGGLDLIAAVGARIKERVVGHAVGGEVPGPGDIDGLGERELEATTSSPGVIRTNSKPFFIGRSDASGGNRYFNGAIDEVRLWNVARSQTEIQSAPNPITGVQVAADGLSVRLKVDGLRELYIHELHADGIRSAAGESLDHADAYYTLNRIPKN